MNKFSTISFFLCFIRFIWVCFQVVTRDPASQANLLITGVSLCLLFLWIVMDRNQMRAAILVGPIFHLAVCIYTNCLTRELVFDVTFE